MELLEKMHSFLRKKPSNAELERIDKKKVEADRSRMEDMRARMEAAGAFAPSAPMTEEEKATVRSYFREACEQAKSVMATSFRVEGIDRYTADTISILEKAMQDGGSYKTILRCFQGIAFGIQNAHEPIPEHAIETDVVSRRENTAAQYFHLAQMSLEIDRLKRDVDRKHDQKRQLDLEYEKVEKDLQDMIDAHPRVWYDLEEMSPSDVEAATGDTKIMAGLQKRAVDIQKNINQVNMLIGHRQQEVFALESSSNALFLQVSNQESHIDDQSMADVLRLQKEFEKEMLREQKRIKELNNSFDAFDKAINYILVGKEEREWEISTWRKYQEMKKQLQYDEARDEAGRQRYQQEQEEQRLEAQKLAQEQSETNTQSSRSLYYN